MLIGDPLSVSILRSTPLTFTGIVGCSPVMVTGSSPSLPRVQAADAGPWTAAEAVTATARYNHRRPMATSLRLQYRASRAPGPSLASAFDSGRLRCRDNRSRDG